MLFHVNRAKRRNEVQYWTRINGKLWTLKVHLVEQTIEDRGAKFLQCCQRGRIDLVGGNETATCDDHQRAIAPDLGEVSGKIAEVGTQNLFGKGSALLSVELLKFGQLQNLRAINFPQDLLRKRSGASRSRRDNHLEISVARGILNQLENPAKSFLPVGIIDDQGLACNRDLFFRVFIPEGLIFQKDSLHRV